jgi:hypothetical protein
MECLFDRDKPHFATWLWIYNEDQWEAHFMWTMRPEEPEAVPLYYAAMMCCKLKRMDEVKWTRTGRTVDKQSQWSRVRHDD